MKIHIIGGSGTGKTYFAKALSEKHSIKHYDLDDIQWDNNADGYGVKMPIEKRTVLLNEILKNDSWVIEGVYYAWVGDCFKQADIIYLLDIPKRIYFFRIIKRSIMRKIGLEKGKKETFKSVYNLLKWTNTYQKKNLPAIKELLKEYKEKTIVIRNKQEISYILAD